MNPSEQAPRTGRLQLSALPFTIANMWGYYQFHHFFKEPIRLQAATFGHIVSLSMISFVLALPLALIPFRRYRYGQRYWWCFALCILILEVLLFLPMTYILIEKFVFT